jgi:hypothetical protein
MWCHCACAEVCLPSRCLEAGCITPSFHFCVRVSLSNGCFCGSTVLAWNKYATKYILSRVGVGVTNNNVFWIQWLDLLSLLLQSRPIITAHNQWLPKTRSIPYWTTSVFSSTVTNDERRITAHTLNCLERRLSENLSNSRTHCLLYLPCGRDRSHHVEQFLCSLVLSRECLC